MVPSCSLPVYFLEPLGSFVLYTVFYQSKLVLKTVITNYSFNFKIFKTVITNYGFDEYTLVWALLVFGQYFETCVNLGIFVMKKIILGQKAQGYVSSDQESNQPIKHRSI